MGAAKNSVALARIALMAIVAIGTLLALRCRGATAWPDQRRMRSPWVIVAGLAIACSQVACGDLRPNEVLHPTPENLPSSEGPSVRATGAPQGLTDARLRLWSAMKTALVHAAGSDAVFALGRPGTIGENSLDIFGTEIDAAMDRNTGGLLVLDRANHSVKIFNQLGDPIGSFGNAGQGPGEFLDPSAIESMADGTIAVVDRGNRVNFYAPSNSGYAHQGTQVFDMVPERACSANGRLWVSGWHRDEQAMIHEVDPAQQNDVMFRFGRGYRSDYWLVQDQLSDGPIACLTDRPRVVFAFEQIPVLHAYDADQGELLWSTHVKGWEQTPIIEVHRDPQRQPSIRFERIGVQEIAMTLTRISHTHKEAPASGGC